MNNFWESPQLQNNSIIFYIHDFWGWPLIYFLQGFAHHYAGLKSHSKLTLKNSLFLVHNSLDQVIFDQISAPKLWLAKKINQCGKKLWSNMTNFEKNGKIPIKMQVHFFELKILCEWVVVNLKPAAPLVIDCSCGICLVD